MPNFGDTEEPNLGAGGAGGIEDAGKGEPAMTSDNATTAQHGAAFPRPVRVSSPTETIRADEVGIVKDLKRQLEPTQQAGLYLAIGVGTLVVAVTVLLVTQLLSQSPWLGAPSGLDRMDPAKAKALIENVKTLNDLAVDRCTKIFDALVARSLLPIFTAILGYIFGTRSASNGRNAG